MGVDLFHAEGRTDSRDEANSHFFEMLRKRLTHKTFYVTTQNLWTGIP